jgi:hypothetical protein
VADLGEELVEAARLVRGHAEDLEEQPQERPVHRRGDTAPAGLEPLGERPRRVEPGHRGDERREPVRGRQQCLRAQFLLGPEVVEEHPVVAADRGAEPAQREVRDAVLEDVTRDQPEQPFAFRDLLAPVRPLRHDATVPRAHRHPREHLSGPPSGSPTSSWPR